MLAEYQSYSQEVGVFELGPDDYALKQLTTNLTTKALQKYWPYLLAVVLAFVAALALAAWIVRTLIRRAAA